jgi:hypothetical protein
MSVPDFRNSAKTMNCQELAHRIERLQPEADTRDVARLCLLLANWTQDIDALEDENVLVRAWREVNLRWQATADQHAAMTEELEDLAQSDPRKFSADQIWILIRAIQVQHQILQLYLGNETLTV